MVCQTFSTESDKTFDLMLLENNVYYYKHIDININIKLMINNRTNILVHIKNCTWEQFNIIMILIMYGLLYLVYST